MFIIYRANESPFPPLPNQPTTRQLDPIFTRRNNVIMYILVVFDKVVF